MKQSNSQYRRHVTFTLLAGCAAILPASVQAQDAVDPPAETANANVIVVTAQKRQQSASDVPIALTALSSDRLPAASGNDVASIAEQASNVVATSSANLPAFTVRGIGLNEFAANFDSPVAVHVDEVYKSKPFMVSIPMYDLDRVEILKGPQGTLFGRNTTGGSVNFYTATPTDDSSGYFALSADNHGRFRGEAVGNAPLADNLAMRISLYGAQGVGGPYYNLFTEEDYGAPDQIAARGQLLWSGPRTDILLKGEYFRDRSELTPYKSPGLFNSSGAYCAPLLAGNIDDDRSACLRFGPAVPAGNVEATRETQDVREANANVEWLANNKAHNLSMRVTHDLGFADLTAITAYQVFRRAQTEDSDNSPITSIDSHYYSRIEQFSQELRLSGSAGELDWLVGGYFENDNLDEADSTNVLLNPLVATPPGAPRLAADFKQEVRSLALFTHNEFAVTPEVSLVAGLRFTSDRTKIDANTYLGANDPEGIAARVTPAVPVDMRDDSRTDNTWSFRGGVNWKPTRDHLLYASVSRGFRSGGYSIPFGGAITEFKPEKLTAYEIGYKGELFDRELAVNLGAFWYDYQDLQANVDDPVSPIVPITRNIGASRNRGVEGELIWRPDMDTTLSFSASYLDAEYTDTDRSVTTYAGPVALEGKRPVNTPKWTLQAFAQKTVPLDNGYELKFQTDGRYLSSRYLESTNQVFDRADGYFVQNARIALASDAGWEVALWGKNIWDEEYLTYLNNVGFFRVEIYGEPASYGGSIRFDF